MCAAYWAEREGGRKREGEGEREGRRPSRLSHSRAQTNPLHLHSSICENPTLLFCSRAVVEVVSASKCRRHCQTANIVIAHLIYLKIHTYTHGSMIRRYRYVLKKQCGSETGLPRTPTKCDFLLGRCFSYVVCPILILLPHSFPLLYSRLTCSVQPFAIHATDTPRLQVYTFTFLVFFLFLFRLFFFSFLLSSFAWIRFSRRLWRRLHGSLRFNLFYFRKQQKLR